MNKIGPCVVHCVHLLRSGVHDFSVIEAMPTIDRDIVDRARAVRSSQHEQRGKTQGKGKKAYSEFPHGKSQVL